MKIISCHLFPRRKTGTNLLEKQFDPPSPSLELSGSAHACLTGILFFYFLHVKGLAIVLFLEINWWNCAGALADLRLCCLHIKKFLAELGKKAKLQI